MRPKAFVVFEPGDGNAAVEAGLAEEAARDDLEQADGRSSVVSGEGD